MRIMKNSNNVTIFADDQCPPVNNVGSGAMYYVYGHGLAENTVIVAVLSEWQPHSFVIAAFGGLEQLGLKQYYAAEISNGFLVEMYIVEEVMNNVCFIFFH